MEVTIINIRQKRLTEIIVKNKYIMIKITSHWEGGRPTNVYVLINQPQHT